MVLAPALQEIKALEGLKGLEFVEGLCLLVPTQVLSSPAQLPEKTAKIIECLHCKNKDCKATVLQQFLRCLRPTAKRIAVSGSA